MYNIVIESNDPKDADGCIVEQFRFVWLVRRPGLEHLIDMSHVTEKSFMAWLNNSQCFTSWVKYECHNVLTSIE